MDTISSSKTFYSIQVLKLLRIDLFAFLYLLALTIPGVTITQLVQDKYCINQLKLDPSKCLQLEQLGPEYDHFKNSVYIFSTKFANYNIAISTPFGIISAILVGFWVDKYPGYTKYIIATPALGGFLGGILEILNVYYFKSNIYHLLWKTVVYSLTGTMNSVLTGVYAYTIRRTRSEYRVARFAILEFFKLIATPIGTALGGKLLTVSNSFFGLAQYRNYYLVFSTNLIINLVAFVWVMLTLNDAEDKINDDSSRDIKMMPIDDSKNLSDSSGKDENFSSIISKVLRLSTINGMVKTVFRRRPARRRAILLHLTFGMIIAFVGALAELVIGLQFAQKVYHWNASFYAYTYSYMIIIPTIVNTLFPLFMTRIGGIFDSTYCIIGSISLTLSLAIKGGILEPYAYYISWVVGIFAHLLVTVKRSIVSRIIDQNESGQVFSLIVSIEGLSPLIISIFFTQIFAATIDTAPGTAHLIVAFMMLYPYTLSLWLGINVYKWDPAAIKYLEEKKKIKSNVS